MGPVWGGAKTHWTLSAHRYGATALYSKTRGSVVEEVGGLPHPTVVGALPVRSPSIRRDGTSRRSRKEVCHLASAHPFISARGQSPFELRADLRIRGGRWGNTERPSGVEGEGDWRGASRRASASFGEPMGPVWGGAKTHRTLSALSCGATKCTGPHPVSSCVKQSRRGRLDPAEVGPRPVS